MSANVKAEVCIAAAANVVHLLIKRRCRRRRNRLVWVRRWIADRHAQGAYNQLMVHLRTTDVEGFNNFIRMDPATFDELVLLITPLIERRDTNYRHSISPGERLAVTLRFLASGKRTVGLQELILLLRMPK